MRRKFLRRSVLLGITFSFVFVALPSGKAIGGRVEFWEAEAGNDGPGTIQTVRWNGLWMVEDDMVNLEYGHPRGESDDDEATTVTPSQTKRFKRWMDNDDEPGEYKSIRNEGDEVLIEWTTESGPQKQIVKGLYGLDWFRIKVASDGSSLGEIG